VREVAILEERERNDWKRPGKAMSRVSTREVSQAVYRGREEKPLKKER